MDDTKTKAPPKNPMSREKNPKNPGIYNPLTETVDFRREMNDGDPHKEPKVIMPPPQKGHGGMYEPNT